MTELTEEEWDSVLEQARAQLEDEAQHKLRQNKPVIEPDQTASQYLSEVIKPDKQDDFPKVFTKELKVSNIDKQQHNIISETSDVAIQCRSMIKKIEPKALNSNDNFHDELLAFRDVFLSATSSIGMGERKLQTTVTNIQKMKTEESGGFNIFKKKRRE